MHRGIALVAPKGFGSLCNDTIYHLLANPPGQSTVLLVWFLRGKSEWAAHFVRIQKLEFEEALIGGRVVPAATQSAFPPWLKAYENVDFSTYEDSRVSKKQSYKERAEARFEAIKPLLDRSVEIESVVHPEEVINQYVKDHNSLAAAVANQKLRTLNSGRIRLWYCVFRIFGEHLYSLASAYAGIGSWERRDHESSKKHLGRPSRKGKNHGHSAIPLAEKICDCYARHQKLGLSMSEIHRRSLMRDFGCKTTKNSNGRMEFYHPENMPYPTRGQFEYWVIKKFGRECVQRNRLGSNRVRRAIARNVGSFSEQSANLYDRTESDVYQVNELPRKLLSSEPGLPLMVARLVDTTSSVILGIGFSYGAERAEAYSSMLFSAAVPKSLLGRLFGIDIDEERWFCKGLPPRHITDRGPGASDRMIPSFDGALVIREMSQSYSGQAKAIVETSHPKNVQFEDAPSYEVSDSNVFQMAKREVFRVISDNNSKDVSNRLTPEMLAAGVQNNPLSIAQFLDRRGRTDAISVQLEQAVRKYLAKYQFDLKPDGLWYECVQYRSPAFVEKLQSFPLKKGQSVKLDGYFFPLSTRLAWVEIQGELIEVEATLPIRDDADQLYISLSELHELSQRRDELMASQPEHSSAVKAGIESEFYEQVGQHWSATSRKYGKKPGRRSLADEVPTAASKKKARRS